MKLIILKFKKSKFIGRKKKGKKEYTIKRIFFFKNHLRIYFLLYSIMPKKEHDYTCVICNKEYSTYHTLWIHNKKFHSDTSENTVTTVTKPVTKPVTNAVTSVTNCSSQPKVYPCPDCGKKFNCRQNKYQHQKYCKKELIVVDDKPNIDHILNNSNTNINTQVNNNNTNNGTQQINNGTQQINNGTINNTTQNIVINQIGTESLEGFSLKDILSIVKEGNNMPITCVKKVNFNKKYPENHSFCATTLEGKHFTRINHKTQKPEKINKVDFINEVLVNSLKFIQNISLMVEFDESFKNSIPLEHQQKIKDILANQEKFHDPKNKKAFFNCINDMSYNFKDIILETWKLIQPTKNIDTESDSETELLFDENYKYVSSDEEN